MSQCRASLKQDQSKYNLFHIIQTMPKECKLLACKILFKTVLNKDDLCYLIEMKPDLYKKEAWKRLLLHGVDEYDLSSISNLCKVALAKKYPLC